MIDYKAAYSYLRGQLDTLADELSKSEAAVSPAEAADTLRRISAEGDEILSRESPYPLHRAPRSGSSL